MTTVIWIDWYSYHVSRFRALFEHAEFNRQVSGIELVGGCGVHRGLRFRDADREGLPILSLFPDADWDQTGQWTLALAVWRKLNELSPSAILVPGWYTLPAIAAAVWAKLRGRRSILMSETTEFDHPRVWWKESIKQVLVRLLFDFGVAGGKPHLRYLAQLGFKPERIARFYDVVDNDFYRDEAERARLSAGLKLQSNLPDTYFLYVGRLAPEKNLVVAIRAYAQYRQRGGTWSLVLVGDGPDRKILEDLSREMGMSEHIRFAGLKSSKEITTYYAFASCFVLPSRREPWGLVVNEAMASGLPVIASNRCGCAEDLVLPGGNGFLFDPKSENELADKLLKISGLKPIELEAMREKSRELIAEYSPANWAREVARLVQESGPRK